MIDGGVVFRKPIGGPEDQALADRKAGTGRAQIMERFSKIPVQVEAGVHDVVVASTNRPMPPRSGSQRFSPSAVT
jgi:hypothetical protein